MADKPVFQDGYIVGKDESIYKDPARTCLEKILVILLSLSLVAIVILAALLAASSKSQEAGVCLTKECTEIAAHVVSSIDYSVNPCDNFYDFACGNWMKTHVVPEDRSNLYTYGVLRDNVRITVKYLLEGDMDSDLMAVQNARNFYQSCMNETQIEQLNITVMTDLLEHVGGWPVLGSNPGGNWNESNFNFFSELLTLREYGISPILRIYIGLDEKENGKRIIQFDEPLFGLTSKNYYFDKEHSHLREAYETFMINIAILLGAEATTAKADIQDVFALDTDFANLSLSNSERRSREDMYNKITLEELENMSEPIPGNFYVNWTEFIQRTLAIGNPNVTIRRDEPMIMETPKYYKHVFQVLQNYTVRTVRNYMLWSMISQLINLMPKRFLDEYTIYRQVQYGTNIKESRWKKCSQATMNCYGMAVGRLFVKETFDEEAKQKALDMIHDIREAFSQRLDVLTWMDEQTRAVAKEKALNIKEKIGYDDFILNDTALNDYYKDMQVSKDAFFHNMVYVMRTWSKQALKSLREPYEKENSRWETPPSVVNAYYAPLLNMISFPAGMLQPPYYSKYQPRSMNYGSIGFLIGHEITHGFDDIGRQYDKEGNLKQWWSNEAIQRFTNVTKCFLHQYNKYVTPLAQLNLDGVFTQGENIADNGGIQQSYKAYKNWQERSMTKEPRLPGVDFTHDQLFFINFAQGWCGVATKQYEMDIVHTDQHAPGRFRIIGSLQNSVEFSEAFKCPVGSYMNPENKCHVW